MGAGGSGDRGIRPFPTEGPYDDEDFLLRYRRKALAILDADLVLDLVVLARYLL